MTCAAQNTVLDSLFRPSVHCWPLDFSHTLSARTPLACRDASPGWHVAWHKPEGILLRCEPCARLPRSTNALPLTAMLGPYQRSHVAQKHVLDPAVEAALQGRGHSRTDQQARVRGRPVAHNDANIERSTSAKQSSSLHSSTRQDVRRQQPRLSSPSPHISQ